MKSVVNQEEGSSEAIRRKHLSHEASIKSYGSLCMLGAVIMTLSFPLIFFGLTTMTSQEIETEAPSTAATLGLAALWIANIVFAFFVARGLWQLTKFGKIGGTISAVFGLIAFPLGTLIGAYVLYLIWSSKGHYIFSPEYKEVIAATPYVKYKMSIIVKIFLYLLIGVVLLGVFLVVLAAIATSMK